MPIFTVILLLLIYSSSVKSTSLDPRLVNDGLWPTSPNYLNFSYKNLDPITTLFSHCFVHLINYQNIDIATDAQVPVAISRYDYVLINKDFLNSTRRLDYVQFLLENGTQLPKEIEVSKERWKYTEEYVPLIYRANSYRGWSCSLQIYLFPPEESTSRDSVRLCIQKC